jgi:hypothetical protein
MSTIRTCTVRALLDYYSQQRRSLKRSMTLTIVDSGACRRATGRQEREAHCTRQRERERERDREREREREAHQNLLTRLLSVAMAAIRSWPVVLL